MVSMTCLFQIKKKKTQEFVMKFAMETIYKNDVKKVNK